MKAGVFLLARLFPALSGTPEWSWLVGGVGLATLLLGAFAALVTECTIEVEKVEKADQRKGQ